MPAFLSSDKVAVHTPENRGCKLGILMPILLFLTLDCTMFLLY